MNVTIYDQSWKNVSSWLSWGVILKHFYNVQVIYRICIVTIVGVYILQRLQFLYLEKETIFINCFYFIITNKINMKENYILVLMIVAYVVNTCFFFNPCASKMYLLKRLTSSQLWFRLKFQTIYLSDTVTSNLMSQK